MNRSGWKDAAEDIAARFLACLIVCVGIGVIGTATGHDKDIVWLVEMIFVCAIWWGSR